METTRMSTKGQLALPKSIRSSRAWGPGTEFTVEETGEGVLLRPTNRFPATELVEVVGCLRYEGNAKAIAKMNDAVQREVVRRHDRGRY